MSPTVDAAAAFAAVAGFVVVLVVASSLVRQRESSARLRRCWRSLAVGYRTGGDLRTDELLQELRSTLHAGRAEITVAEGNGWRRTSLSGLQARTRSSSSTDPQPELPMLANGRVHVGRLGSGSALRAHLVERLGPEGVLVPLRDGPLVLGFLGVGEPRGRNGFTRDDLKLLDAVAGRAASDLEALRQARLARYHSSHDRLTGLPDRTRFLDLLSAGHQLRTVLVVDLDHLRAVNEARGPGFGDRLIREAVARVVSVVGRSGVVARLGGDELGVAVPLDAPPAAAACAARLVAQLSRPYELGGSSVALGATVGVAVDATPAGPDPARLLVEAESALFSAKADHCSWQVHSPHHERPDRSRLSLAAELRAAIDGGQLEVHYQPKLDLRTGTVFGMEALVRWRHPDRGLLPPDTFVPLAEDTGLIRPLTLWVLDVATRTHQELRQRGFGGLELAVNLSLRSMVELDFPDRIGKVLRTNGMPPTSLTLEVTESNVLADEDRTIRMLERLADLGTTISVDDFGTGYASLSHLARLPAGELKIDRSFVVGMLDAPRDATIVASTIDLARSLGLRAVAEGVEDADTLAALSDLGCDQAQGYYVSRPLPADQLHGWLSGNTDGDCHPKLAGRSRR